MTGPDGGGARLRVTATHVLVGGGAPRAGDALAAVDGDVAGARRVFVPAPLPCGECATCRRALTAACRSPQTPLSLDQQQSSVAERFVTPISEPAWANLAAPVIAAAGLAAEVLEATARSGLGPGDTAIWIGVEPWVSLGASFSARRSCRTFTVASGPRARAEAIVDLDPGGDAAAWQRVLADAEASSGAGHGRPERRIFVYGAGAAPARAALRLTAPGSTLSFRRGTPASLDGLDRCGGPVRILVGGGYHPDLIPEALALLSRGEIDVAPAIREIELPELDSALAALEAGRDVRLPLVRLRDS
ncbi:MAG TPA: hypothetical protein VMU50_23225 [Polyangia bacterium]|nr:hypothetical protein [Polyangia bacterium]